MTPKTKTTKAKQPASNKPKAPKAPKKPATQADVLAAIGKLLAEVDQVMATRDTKTYGRSVQWTRPFYGSLSDITKKMQPLLEKLDSLVRAGQPKDSEFGGPDTLLQHFSTAPGEKLTWSRPGAFLTWIGDIPVRCLWGGYPLSSMNACTAISPRKMFLSDTGAAEVYVGAIEPQDADPEAVLRKRITQRLHVRQHHMRGHTPEPPLVQLSRDGIEKVQAFRADPANAWWLTAAAGSPVDAIALPPDLPAVQTKLFG